MMLCLSRAELIALIGAGALLQLLFLTIAYFRGQRSTARRYNAQLERSGSGIRV